MVKKIITYYTHISNSYDSGVFYDVHKNFSFILIFNIINGITLYFAQHLKFTQSDDGGGDKETILILEVSSW